MVNCGDLTLQDYGWSIFFGQRAREWVTDQYPNLHKDYGWTCTVHRAPVGYEHPWVAVCKHYTVGCWSRDEARECRRRMVDILRPIRMFCDECQAFIGTTDCHFAAADYHLCSPCNDNYRAEESLKGCGTTTS